MRVTPGSFATAWKAGLLPMALLSGIGCASTSASPPSTPSSAPSTSASPPTTATPAQPIVSASFTAKQVERGRGEFRGICADCHSASEFRGNTFLYEWRRRTAWDFFRELTETMPDDAPGSLTDQQYVDVTAYVLQMNGYVAGESELAATEAMLDQFAMDGAATPRGSR